MLLGGPVSMPMLAIVGSERDTWGPLPEPVLAERLNRVPRLERRTVGGTGHFGGDTSEDITYHLRVVR